MPSMNPTVTIEVPSITGNSAWIISDEISISSDTKPSAQTPRGICASEVLGFGRSITSPPLLDPKAKNRHRLVGVVSESITCFKRSKTERRYRLVIFPV